MPNSQQQPTPDGNHVDRQGHHSVEAKKDEPNTPRCGLCSWRPDCLQIGYNWKLGLLMMCWFSLLHGMLSNGFISVNSTMYERQFNVGSEMIGWFTSANKLATASTTVITSYYADQTHKPRVLALAGLLYMIGSLLLALPHYIMETIDRTAQALPAMCYSWDTLQDLALFGDSWNTNATTNHLQPDCASLQSQSAYFNFLIAGNVVLGVGAGIIFTVGLTFIDDFSTTASSSLNIGSTYLCNAIGSAIGFSGGAGMLMLDVDFDRKKKAISTSSDLDPYFIGAWWLGPTICIGLFATVAVGFAFFDREVPETSKFREQKLAHDQTHKTNLNTNIGNSRCAGRNKFLRVIATFIDNLVRLLTNPVCIFMALASIFNSLIGDGLQPFFVKMMRTQFGMTESSAGIAIGVLTVVGIASGCFLSGLMAQRLDMSVRSLLLVTVVFSSLSLVLSFSQIITCSKEALMGVTFDADKIDYYPPGTPFNKSNLVSVCNDFCDPQCDPQYFEPVCVRTPEYNFEYFSACYAGCQRYDFNASYPSFIDCACLPEEMFPKNTTKVEYGTCDMSCSAMYIALVGMFLVLFCGFFIIVPITEVIIRSVPLEERSFALAFNQSIGSFLGSIPGPIIMGLIFDMSCLLWQPKETCKQETSATVNGTSSTTDELGSCLVYDTDTLSFWFAGILGGLNVLTIISYILAFLLYRPPSGETLRQYFRTLGHWWKQALCGRCIKGNKPDAEEKQQKVDINLSSSTRNTNQQIPVPAG